MGQLLKVCLTCIVIMFVQLPISWATNKTSQKGKKISYH